MSFKYVVPLQLDLFSLVYPASDFVATTIPSTTPPYSIGDQVKKNILHPDTGYAYSRRIFVSITDNNNTDPPDYGGNDNWELVGVDNYYALRDFEISSVSECNKTSTELYISYADGVFSDIAEIDLIHLNNLNATRAILSYTTDAGSVASNKTYTQMEEVSLVSANGFNNPNVTFQFTANASATAYRIELINDSGVNLYVGKLLCGMVEEIPGFVQNGLKLGAEDYSINTTNKFGTTTLVQRPFLKRVSFTDVISTDVFNQCFRTFSQRRAQNTLWIPTLDTRYSEAIVFGTGSCEQLAKWSNYAVAEIELKGTT